MSINNAKGSITLLGILFSLFVFSMLITIIYLEKTFYYNLKSRFLTYLCFKHHLIKTQKYVKSMERLNNLINITFPLTLNPVTAAKATTAINSFKLGQNLLHGSYLKNISYNQFCSYQQNLPSVINLPYATTSLLILKRTPNHLVILRKNKWNLLIPNINKYQKQLLPDFYLKAEITKASQVSTDLQITTSEIKSKKDSVF
ncbi:MAG: hypothetical protein A2381_02710 [Bdellovibrionales bacterium RIFOXYB1_FULL_37_110]|nr:MAG: hypothetical protein A2181_05090 [Bdellovibrionales bacterium RIFOXYA1_FULL_38_20]OFZ52609.1 MAG: hypothetical protein A2417_01045 [Bdellovibrionales bacterium RIFOXYC1_FULL_37_79]OFZ58299.1 MAG: hypothetical protein A2381_02710 [Bdellovibrionales bacterium RIFOXYB1_FULL_37_110]OFZ65282.1 MAG: hypothetical protein A2577_04005 [Bdellovibrionales bacterium RIFOXYD1_FULL_36_51]